MGPAPFRVESEVLEGGIRALSVHGELDMNTAPELERELDEALEASDSSLLLDLSSCEFIDSTGIALIVRTWHRVDRDGDGEGNGHLALCCVNDQVHRLLTITGVDTSISIHGKRDQALADLKTEPA